MVWRPVGQVQRAGERPFHHHRVIAGDRRLGQEFVDTTRAWVFGRGLDFAAITSLKHIKQRIERRTRSEGAERTEVKLGYGGIRDVEFIADALTARTASMSRRQPSSASSGTPLTSQIDSGIVSAAW